MEFNANQTTATPPATTVEENVAAFAVRDKKQGRTVDIISRKNNVGDFDLMLFKFKDAKGNDQELLLDRDEITAISFALSREDQQSKLLNMKFRQYKEVPVRLCVMASKDIKKGEMVTVFRKERVPIENEYTYEKFNNSLKIK